ncbi:hypothetical protein [Streptococcus gallolyticus]|uniref:Uncharacterized protein n=1 Tax=Streptococcus gallolyticus TaxID=315405 RepID=A0A1I7FJF1_9STRE|nr:hypothetical protein [Streptococcus gallolyticus]SFC08836.1 hypothetical protein SAMN02983012_0571 [Streptococcus gallolyticus]SFU36311.1 hypothetical protein SAMN05660328_101423 [Streptococcus gallolyticus]
MSNRKKTIIISVIIGLLVLVTSFFGYRTYRYYDFKRAYEQGTLVEQLDVLMNSKRYVKAIRHAGYEVDDYELISLERVDSLVTKGTPEINVKAPSELGNVIIQFKTIIDGEDANVYFQLDKDFKVTYQSVEDENGNDIDITSVQQEKLLKVVKKELKTMLKTIYESMYA